MQLRLAKKEDVSAILDIYKFYVESTSFTFEYTVPSLEAFQHRLAKTLERYPWLVVKHEEQLMGYAYATGHRSRQAYQWSVESSVYVHQHFQKQGLGTLLYQKLFKILELQGFYNVYAGVALPNPRSEAFHKSLGFKRVGVYEKIGFKFNQWHDVAWWSLELPQKLATANPLPPKNLPEVSDQVESLLH